MQQNPLSCDHCGETFQRREHRDRHVLRHTGLKPFQCNVCSKSFSRNDTLTRHRALHGSQPGSTRTRRRRRGQACIPCSKVKQSCDGGHPCSRCENRELECIYPARDSGAQRDDSPTIIVGELSQGQDISASSPLTAQGADFQEEAFMPGQLDLTSEEWDNPPSIPSDTSVIPTNASSTIYPTVLDTSSNCPIVPTMPDTFTLNGTIHSLGTMTDNPWMPWNSSMAHFTFPWFIDELEMPLELPDMAHHHEEVAHHAVLTQQVGEGPAYLTPENICSTYTQPCHPFPETEAIGLQMAGAEVFGHIHNLPGQAVEGLNNFYTTQRRDKTPTAIPQDILHAFVDLYFEYFDSQFPFLHPSRLEDPNLPWMLLLAVAAVGSHYSEIPGSEQYNTALCDLLARAVELPASRVHDNIANVDVTTVQCVFLLHVLWLFSGSHRDKIVLQHKRSSLATMCWDLVGKADKRRQSTQTEPHSQETWQAWISEESEIRLATCVRVLECLSHIFLGTPLVFNLRDATRQLPCPERLWRIRNALEWNSLQEDSTGNDPKPDAFAAKVILLELYIDNMNHYRQMRSSQLLQSSFASYLNSPATNDTQYAPNSSLQRPDTVRSESALLDTTINQLTLNNKSDHGASTDTILHVIAILRMIPLETLHSATGWETNKEQMMKSKMHLKDFFKNDSVKARKGLWHATCIFKTTRSSRRLTCYDALSLTVAMGYIYCYSETRASLVPTSTRPVITRLDQLQDPDAVEKWIENGDDNVVHLTGVGLLDGSDHCVRFLRDLERTLVSQIAWRGFCRAFASSFAQLRRGETPTKSSREYLNAE
ncbi:hypothetical protein LB504_011688 [Fusarium proliferatum]|nr:hypothetical protein LB504_011688 [Fusarium proliferatum]